MGDGRGLRGRYHGSGLGKGEVWMDVVMVLAHGRSGERVRSWWTLSWFGSWTLWTTAEAWMDALGKR